MVKDKRDREDAQDSDSSDDVGPPMPTAEEQAEADKQAKEEESCDVPINLMSKPKKKKRKVLQHEALYLDALPSGNQYERSYMHRDTVTHVVVTKTNFIITGSCDGLIQFWSKCEEGGIEFVKTMRSHLGAITGMGGSVDGLFMATASDDMSLKIYDIVNFDMINMMKVDYVPGLVEWITKPGSLTPLVAVGETSGSKIRIYEGRGANVPVREIDMHSKPLTCIKYDPTLNMVATADESGMIEFFNSEDYEYPSNVLKFEFKSDTDLYEFAKAKAIPWGLSFSRGGKFMAALASDRKVRVFVVATGKLYRVYDESIDTIMASNKNSIDISELGRISAEKELLKSPAIRHETTLFDESGNFLMYPTMMGIKCVNIITNKCSRIIGKGDNIRCLRLAFHTGVAEKQEKAATTFEYEAADNPGLHNKSADPTFFCTAAKKSRFYMFTKREPEEQGSMEVGRDVFNLKPTREEQLAATGVVKQRKLAEQVTIHTSMGDITINLFLTECPKTVENFVTHCRDGYYNGNVFHRVIKGFMIQTGDPLGDGTGGESIWGGEFEDEFHATLKHDRPYTVSMANAGPNTNGSQFFITLVPTAWLDGKHTVFGRVTKGMETCQTIGNVQVNKKNDEPFEPIKIINVSVK
eukprot:m.79570 g.79570  ORF g.79570 m.79570 type:complete len:638 (-) comp12718_c0_seq2:600-2513(-)